MSRARPVTILLLPLLFMSGMCFLDTLNGFFMAWVYRRSLQAQHGIEGMLVLKDEMQMVYFNLFLTTTSGGFQAVPRTHSHQAARDVDT